MAYPLARMMTGLMLNRCAPYLSSEATNFDNFMKTLQRLHDSSERQRREHLAELAQSHNLQYPPVDQDAEDSVDIAMVRFLTGLARQTQLALPAFVRHFRGETQPDPRPNKALFEVETPIDQAIRDRVHQWNSIVRSGVHTLWKSDRPPRQRLNPPNHASVAPASAQVHWHLRKGQRDGRYLIVDS